MIHLIMTLGIDILIARVSDLSGSYLSASTTWSMILLSVYEEITDEEKIRICMCFAALTYLQMVR